MRLGGQLFISNHVKSAGQSVLENELNSLRLLFVGFKILQQEDSILLQRIAGSIIGVGHTLRILPVIPRQAEPARPLCLRGKLKIAGCPC